MAVDTPRYSWEELLDSRGIKVCSFDELYRLVHSQEALYNYHRTAFYHIFRYKGEENFHYAGYNKKIIFRNNSLLIINQNILHKFSRQKCNGDVILFNAAFFGSTKEKIEFLDGCSLFQRDYTIINSQNDYFQASVESYVSLMRMKADKEPVTVLTLLRNWLHNLLVTIEREYQSQRKQFEIPNGQNYTHEDDVRQFRILLDTYYRTQKQVGFYAKELNISEKKLAEAVFSVHGISVKRYINEKVLTEAVRLLENTTLTQGEIACELGFDFTYFIKFFRKLTGITPARYRQKR
jgi:AraC-like DNA-binding protein